MPKVKNSRFLERMDWKGKKRYQNAKFIYNWHPILEQILGELTIKLRKFLMDVYLRGQQWWECPKNSCLCMQSMIAYSVLDSLDLFIIHFSLEA